MMPYRFQAAISLHEPNVSCRRPRHVGEDRSVECPILTEQDITVLYCHIFKHILDILCMKVTEGMCDMKIIHRQERPELVLPYLVYPSRAARSFERPGSECYWSYHVVNRLY